MNNTIYKINGKDYKLDIDDVLNLPEIEKQTIEYNQAQQDITRRACGLYSCIGVISDNIGYKFSTEEILEIVELARQYGRSEKTGMRMYRAVDCVRDWYNKKFPQKELVSFRVDTGSEEFFKLLSKGYSLSTGYKTTDNYSKDSQDNGIIDISSVEEMGKEKYGHLIRYSGTDKITDNYKGLKKYNIYTIDKQKTKSFVKGRLFFPSAYILIDKKTVMANKDFLDVDKTNAYYDSIMKMKELGISKGYDDGTYKPDRQITRGEMSVMLDRLYEKLK